MTLDLDKLVTELHETETTLKDLKAKSEQLREAILSLLEQVGSDTYESKYCRVKKVPIARKVMIHDIDGLPLKYKKLVSNDSEIRQGLLDCDSELEKYAELDEQRYSLRLTT